MFHNDTGGIKISTPLAIEYIQTGFPRSSKDERNQSIMIPSKNTIQEWNRGNTIRGCVPHRQASSATFGSLWIGGSNASWFPRFLEKSTLAKGSLVYPKQRTYDMFGRRLLPQARFDSLRDWISDVLSPFGNFWFRFPMVNEKLYDRQQAGRSPG